MYLGDFAPGKTVRVKWNSADLSGAPSSASLVTVKVYKDGSATTETTTGTSHTEDFDAVTGLNEAVVDTAADGTFYSAGSDFYIVATAVTVNGVSLAGLVLGHFSLAARSALRPAIADRTIAVDGSGQVTVGAIANGIIAAATFAANALDAVWSTATRTLTAFGFSVTVGANSDKTGYALTAAYDPAKTASQAGDAMALTLSERTTLAGVIWAVLTSAITTVGSVGKRIVDFLTGDAYARLGAPVGGSVSADIAALPTAAQNADKLLGRSLATGADGGRTVQDALRFNRNKVVISGTTITIYEEDDTTVAWSGTIVRTAADALSSLDPA